MDPHRERDRPADSEDERTAHGEAAQGREYGAAASVDHDMDDTDCHTCHKPSLANIEKAIELIDQAAVVTTQVQPGVVRHDGWAIDLKKLHWLLTTDPGSHGRDDETRSKGRVIRLAVFVTRDEDPCLLDSEGEGAVDVWDELDSPSEPGLWIWDGHARDESGVGEYPHEVYTSTAGEWTRPDPLTLARIGAGLDPWTETQ